MYDYCRLQATFSFISLLPVFIPDKTTFFLKINLPNVPTGRKKLLFFATDQLSLRDKTILRPYKLISRLLPTNLCFKKSFSTI